MYPNRAALLYLYLFLASCAAGDAIVELRGATMGTIYTVKIGELAASVDEKTLHAELEGILARINGRMSTYDPDSELSRFNAAPTTEWVPMSAETVRVVEEALEVSRLTDGAFDVTVGPLVDLWGFGPAPAPEEPPSADEIAAARERVGFERLHARTSEPALRKDHPQLRVDLSAIAKGYAVDQLAEHLESRGVSDYMVEIGGEVRAQGNHPRGSPWRIGIEKPVTDERSIQRVLHIRNRGLATSGDYRNFIELGGERLSHTIDPRTGRPAAHELASVTVMAESSMRADALATGLMALGPEGARDLARRERIAALLIVRRDDGFHEEPTPQIAEALAGKGEH